MAKVGKKKWEVTPPAVNKALYASIETQIRKELTDALDTKKYPKLESYHRVHEAKKKVVEALPEEQQAEAKELFDTLKERIFRDEMLKAKRRPDGRAFDEIRNIDCEVGVLPRTHGSALFTRGETQALVTVTLGTKDDEQRIEMFDLTETSKRFMLHYNFPPFSVGEVGFMRGAGRREIGHGALAERSLSAVIPDDKKFPYTMRVVSDILESNGSSSMASVCGGALALMDAGVPIAEPIAGIAMGLVMEGKDYAILTDIAGAEDHYGDMDFKVAGSRRGITGLQMDIKVPNVTTKIMKEALAQAKGARLFILDKMVATIAAPRGEMSQYAPRIYTLQIPTDKIRDLIGPGGKMIRSIVDETGVKIDVEDDGIGQDFRLRRRIGQAGHPARHRYLRGGRSGQNLSGQSGAAGGIRRVCRDLPGHRRTAAHQRDLGEPHQGGARRVEGRRSDPGEGAGARRQQNQAKPEGRAAGAAGKAKDRSGLASGHRLPLVAAR